MTDISPMSRDEKLLRRALGQSIETEPPQSRIEFLLQEIIDGGGIGTGSYKIKDQYATLAELEAAHPVGEDGDAYLVGDPTHIYVWLDDRQEYADGGLFAAVPGLDGVGITSIEKTATAGLVDTYTITYTDGDTDTFTVTNGAQGEPGEDGEDGVGITSIAKSGTVGNVDTYTITLTDGSTYNFTVTNGEGVGVPEGGTTGQVLVKKSNSDYDTEWANAGAGEGVPAGGTTGQILQKKSNTDYDTEWVDNEGGSDVTSEIESLSAAASELASETGSLSAENSTQTSEINSLSSEYNSLSSEISSNTSDISSLSQSMSELASAAASQSKSQSQIDSTQNVALASLSTENSTQTSEIDSMVSEMASMSVSDITSQIGSLSAENSEQTSEIGSLSQSMSEMAAAASSTSTAQSEMDSTQNVSLASLSTENSTQTSEIGSLSTAESEMASELDVIGSEVAEKQDALVEGPGIDIDSTTNEIKTERVVFEGTLEAWEALTIAEKKSYTDAIITNDEYTGLVDQVPTQGSNHLVTSGGVYEANALKVDKNKVTISTSAYASTSLESALSALCAANTENNVYIGRFKATSTPNAWYSFEFTKNDNYASGMLVNTVDPNDSWTFSYRYDTALLLLYSLSGNNGSVSVTSDGIETYGALMKRLGAAADKNKITNHSKIVAGGRVYTLCYVNDDASYPRRGFCHVDWNGTTTLLARFVLVTFGSQDGVIAEQTLGSATMSNYSGNTSAANVTYTLLY